MSTTRGCCCGCKPKPPWKVGICSTLGKVGDEGVNFVSSTNTGGYLSIFREASEQGLVDEILSTRTLPNFTAGATPSTQEDTISSETVPAIKEVFKKACIIVLGATDFGQAPFDDPGTLDGTPPRSPQFSGDQAYFMPDPQSSVTSELADFLSKRVVKEGAMVIIHTGTRGTGSHPDYESDCTEDELDNQDVFSFIKQEQFDKTNRLLTKLFEDAAIDSSQHIQMTSSVDEDTTPNMKNGGNAKTLAEAINCNANSFVCDECCADYQWTGGPSGLGCSVDYYAFCPFCGPKGLNGKRRVTVHGYNVLKTEVTWLNDPEDEEEYDEELYWQKGMAAKMTGGFPITTTSLETGSTHDEFIRIMQCGKGSVMVVGDPRGFLGRLQGKFQNPQTNWNCSDGNGFDSCITLNPFPDFGTSSYGQLYPYEKNQYVVARILEKVVAQQVTEIQA